MMIDANDVKIIFKTKTKRRIVDLFNYRCPKDKKITEEQLIDTDQGCYLPIDLEAWRDIDTNESFSRILSLLEKLTNPKGGTPVTVIDAAVCGHDGKTDLDFIFVDDYLEGRHGARGYYQNGDEICFLDQIFLTGHNDLSKYQKLIKQWIVR